LQRRWRDGGAPGPPLSSTWPGQKGHLAGRTVQHGPTTPLGVPGTDWGLGRWPAPLTGNERERERAAVQQYLVLAFSDLHLELRTLAVDHGTPDRVRVGPVICRHKHQQSPITHSAVRIFEISNRIEQLLQYSIRNERNYSKFSQTYRHQFLTYLTERRRVFTLATTPSNQQNQQTWSCLRRQCRLKTLNVV